jgi:hypothetical protein
MSTRRISIDQDAVNEILKRSSALVEEVGIMLSGANRALINAEMQGWNDEYYINFKDDFEIAERLIKEGVKQFEETLIPELKKILSSIEDFY